MKVEETAYFQCCYECKRVFDMRNKDDRREWFYGHDCEEKPTMILDEVLKLRLSQAAIIGLLRDLANDTPKASTVMMVRTWQSADGTKRAHITTGSSMGFPAEVIEHTANMNWEKP